jgi:hypothetical protein
MTFKDYINKRRITDTPAGDFVKDARRDRSFPDQVSSWDELRGYLYYRCHGDKDVLDAAREVWQGYRRAAK